MYHVSAQGVNERMINVHYYYYYNDNKYTRSYFIADRSESKLRLAKKYPSRTQFGLANSVVSRLYHRLFSDPKTEG